MADLGDLMKALDANTAELQRNTTMMERLAALRGDAIEAVKAAAATPAKGTKPAAATPAKPTKPAAATPADPFEGLPTAADIEKLKTQKLKVEVSALKGIVAAFVGFPAPDGTPVTDEERKARMKMVAEVLSGEKVQAKTVEDIKPTLLNAVALKVWSFIDQIKTNGWLTGGASEEEAEEEADEEEI